MTTGAREYYSKYDCLYPHFRIEKALKEVEPNQWMFLPTMMLIFRKNFSEVIEISTTFRAREVQEPNTAHALLGTFNSYVNVRCIVRTISDPEHAKLNALRKLCSPPDVSAIIAM